MIFMALQMKRFVKMRCKPRDRGMYKANFKAAKEVNASESQEISSGIICRRRAYGGLARAVKLGIHWWQ